MPVSLGMKTKPGSFGDIETLLQRLARPRPVDLGGIERAVRAGFLNNFRSQGIGGGGSWAALKARTQRERSMQGYGATSPILIRTGAYLRSWVGVGGWRRLEVRPTGWTYFIGSGHRHAFAHELGVRARKLPRRPVRFLDSSDMRAVNNAVEAWYDAVQRSIR